MPARISLRITSVDNFGVESTSIQESSRRIISWNASFSVGQSSEVAKARRARASIRQSFSNILTLFACKMWFQNTQIRVYRTRHTWLYRKLWQNVPERNLHFLNQPYVPSILLDHFLIGSWTTTTTTTTGSISTRSANHQTKWTTILLVRVVSHVFVSGMRRHTIQTSVSDENNSYTLRIRIYINIYTYIEYNQYWYQSYINIIYIEWDFPPKTSYHSPKNYRWDFTPVVLYGPSLTGRDWCIRAVSRTGSCWARTPSRICSSVAIICCTWACRRRR